ncbi:DUF3068 domain-containing protein [Phytohabitans rumicis]|uniref:DUF3068 domain-containing protein n=1 Tax=Phytohabitans rumicis TaxID=1076125 RepID=A0A6V8LAK9_9ACTN|nr:DUF3068 domain-containing protein [Phytohabitans rumicis]GFJ92640.1 hypothetical protein Prum_062820 [Phytohabitans rumicis]
MRRVAAAVLLSLGVFAIVLAALLRFYVHDKLAVAPLDPESTTVSQGGGMTVFYPGTFTQRTDATVTATRIIRGSLTAPEVKVDGDLALWRVGLVLQDDKDVLVSATEEQVCVDRRTAESLAKCSNQRIDDDISVVHSGLAYKFPFNTEKKDYPYFDLNSRASTPPMKFDGEDKVNGLPVYRFVQKIPAVKIQDREVPGSLVKSTEASVTAARMYENTRTVWVEPYSGLIVKGQEEVRQWLRGPDGTDGQVLLAGTLGFTQETVQNQVADGEEARNKLRMIQFTGPLVLLAVGLLLIVGGVFLLPRRRRGGSGDGAEPPREPRFRRGQTIEKASA